MPVFFVTKQTYNMKINFKIFGIRFQFAAFNEAKRKEKIKNDIKYIVLKSLQRRGKTDFTAEELQLLARPKTELDGIVVLKRCSPNLN